MNYFIVDAFTDKPFGGNPAGVVLLGIFVFHEPATFWRIFFLTTLILSIVGLKYVG